MAVELEREFPGAVHTNSQLSASNALGWEHELDGPAQTVAVLVDEPRSDATGPTWQVRSPRQPVTAMLSVHYIARGSDRGGIEFELQNVHDDAERLGRHCQLGRTDRAVVVAIDPEGHVLAARNRMPWPAGVDAVYIDPVSDDDPLMGRPMPWRVPSQLHEQLARDLDRH